MIRPKMMMTMVPSRSGTSKTFFYSRSAHSVVFEIREKEYGQTRVKCLRKGVQTHSMGGASNSARAIMDNFTNEAKTTGCLSKNDEDFLLFSFEREFFFDKKKMCVSTRFLHLLRVVLLLYYDSYSYARARR